ncbi:hypothetical protein ACJW31_10G169300 [Castanea mollissima]
MSEQSGWRRESKHGKYTKSNLIRFSFTVTVFSPIPSHQNLPAAEQLATLPPVSTLPHCHRRAPISQPHGVIFSLYLSRLQSLRLSPSPSCSEQEEKVNLWESVTNC